MIYNSDNIEKIKFQNINKEIKINKHAIGFISEIITRDKEIWVKAKLYKPIEGLSDVIEFKI